MTRIRANCPTCGEVDLLPDDVVLRIVRGAGGDVADGSTYRFACPDCTELIRKPADERIAQLLTTGGVPVEEVARGRPADDRPTHPEGPTGGPALSLDDLLDLHQLLETDDWFDRLAASSH